MTGPLSPRSRLWPHFLLYAAVAVWIDFGNIHARHNSDSLIFSLASLYAWTPFFWEQDRVGLLVPLLCSAVRDPWANLLTQVGLTTFLGLAAHLLLAELAFPHPAGRWAAAACNVALLTLAPPLVLHNQLFECYYPTALFLGCAGLLAVGRGGRWRLVVGLLLMMLAHWVYVAVILALGPLVVWRAWLGRSGDTSGSRRLLAPLTTRRHRRGLGVLLVGFAFGFGLMKTFPPDSPAYVPTPTHALAPADWPASWFEYLNRVIGRDGGGPWLGALLTIGVAGWLVGRRLPPAASFPAGRGAAVLLLAAATEYLFLGTRDWPAQNEYHPRYLAAVFSLFGVGMCGLAAGPLSRWASTPAGRWVNGLAAVGLFAAAAYQFGRPSPATARAGLDHVAGLYTKEFLATRADAVGGTYWKVWPAVYHANLTLHERGESRVVVGFSLRTTPWQPVWERQCPHRLTIAAFRGREQVEETVNRAVLYNLTRPEPVGESGPFVLLSADRVPR